MNAVDAMMEKAHKELVEYGKIVLSRLPMDVQRAMDVDFNIANLREQFGTKNYRFTDNELRLMELDRLSGAPNASMAEYRAAFSVSEMILFLTTLLSSRRRKESIILLLSREKAKLKICGRTAQTIPTAYFVSRISKCADLSLKQASVFWQAFLDTLFDKTIIKLDDIRIDSLDSKTLRLALRESKEGR